MGCWVGISDGLPWQISMGGGLVLVCSWCCDDGEAAQVCWKYHAQRTGQSKARLSSLAVVEILSDSTRSGALLRTRSVIMPVAVWSHGVSFDGDQAPRNFEMDLAVPRCHVCCPLLTVRKVPFCVFFIFCRMIVAFLLFLT
jgi:hypothetical protein